MVTHTYLDEQGFEETLTEPVCDLLTKPEVVCLLPLPKAHH